MGVLVVAEVPELGPEQGAAMAEALGFVEGVDGCRFRVAGPMDGGRRIATYWESVEQYERWRDTRLAEVLKATGTPVPRLEVWEIDDTIGLG